MKRRRCFLVTIALVLSGCYEYLPSPQTGSSSLVGRRVQVTLTDEGSAILAPFIGPMGEAVGGMLLSDTAGSYHIAVLTVRNRSGWETGWKGEIVHVPRNAVMRLEERQLSKRRTTLGSIVLAAALVTAQKAFGGPGGSNAPGGTPTGPSGGR